MTLKQKIISAIIATATIASGFIADDKLIKDVKIGDIMVSSSEHRIIRADIADKASKDAFTEYTDIQLFVDLLNIEKKKCGGKLYPFDSRQDIREMLKRFDEEGCPKVGLK